MGEKELKNILIKIKEADWKVPKNIDVYELSLEMMDNIGSIDPELRDKLILGLLMRIIMYKQISNEEMRGLLEIALSEKHLFNGIGEVESDSVFNRTFTLCIIGAILSVNNESEFLSKEEVLRAYENIMKYFREEKDLRGYVEEKGWAHSTAHCADVLWALSESKEIGYKELIETLETIKEKICVDTYTYINEEEERLINAIDIILSRNLIKDDEFTEWLISFGNVTALGINPNDEHLRENRKKFLRALYFRFKDSDKNSKFINTIEELLEKLPRYF